MKAHTQYVHCKLHSVKESKIKRYSNFISQIPQKHTHWETKSKSHQNIPMNLWDSNLSNQTLSLFLSFFLSQISEELEWNCKYPLKERKMLIMENWRDIIEKTRQLSRFWEKNSIYVVRLNLTTDTTHTHSARFREKMNVHVCEVGVHMSVCVWEHETSVYPSKKPFLLFSLFSLNSLRGFSEAVYLLKTSKKTYVSKSQEFPRISSSEWGTPAWQTMVRGVWNKENIFFF